MAFAKPNTILSPLLNQWKSLLQQWAKGGSLVTAAQEALLLNGIPEGLQILIDEWAAADFKSLPEVELLSAADISGAMGAYAISTGKIYLNETWVDSASKEDVFAVLTEELGHHLDAVLNTRDSSGDEGKRFAVALGLSVGGDPDVNDAGVVLIGSEQISVERAALPILTLRNVELVEGTGSTGPLARLEYVLDRASTEATSFSWATVDGIAKAGSDYEATSGAITIAAGSLTGFVEVQLKADAVQETAETFKVALSNANFLSFSAAESTVSIVDDDKAGILLTAKESLETSERGGSDSFQLVLQSQPTANVSIDLSVSDNTEGRLSTNRVVFTPNNWNQPVTIKLSGLNDIERDGNVAYAVITANSVSTDTYYNNIEIADLAAVNIDSTAEPPASDRLLVTAFTDVINATDGLLTLREAILQSNNSAGGKQIELAAGTYNFSIAGEPSTGLDGTLQGDLDILTSVTIKGAGSAKTIINAKSLDRLFEVFPNITLKLEGLTLTEGKNTDGKGGGALFNSGDLLLKDVVISNNWSPEWGGGLYLAPGSTTTGTDVAVLSNRSEDDGGGIHAAATAGSKAGAKLQFNRAKINSNRLESDRTSTTTDHGEDVYGGGIYVGTGANAELIEAEITGNTAKAIKLGAWVEGVNFSTSWSNAGDTSDWNPPPFPIAVVSHTRTSNSSDVYGGGVYSIGSLSLKEVLVKGNDLLANSSSATVTSGITVYRNWRNGAGDALREGQYQTRSSTLTQPSATYGDAIYASGISSIKASTIINSTGPETIISTGSTEIVNSTIALNSGGTALKVSGGETKIGNTIVAQNAGSTNPDVLGSFVSLGNNLIGDGTGATGFTAEKNDQIGVPSARINPLLADLASNGGFTQSLALRQGSPAIDNGNNAIAGPLDQRNYLRPINGRVDIGAYESFSSPFSISVADASLLEGSRGQRRFDVSVTLAAATPVPVTVALKTADGTAIAGSDYTGIDTTLYFAPGETKKRIGITINSDTIIEPNETFSLNLSNPSFGILGTATATLTLINDDVANGRLVSVGDNLTARVGNLATIPLQIDNAKGVQALDLLFSYDPNLFSLPDVPVIAGTLTTGWTFTTNPNPVAGTIRISAFGSQAITAESGSLAQLQLNSKSTATLLSTTPLSLREAQLNEGGIPAAVDDGTLRFIPDSFHILSSRTTASGVVLELSEAPDLAKLNLYDGQDVSVDTTDVVLSGAVVGSVPLTLYWDSSNRELHLLATSGLLTPDSYTLRIDSRSDGLVTADGGRLLDGDRNGSAGGPFLLQFTNIAPPFSVAVPDLLRGPGQALSLNGAGIAAGVPLRFSLASAVSSITGKLEFNSAVISATLITAGSALPAGWQLTLDTSKASVIGYTISGSTPVSGNNLNLLQFTGRVAATAPYASSSLLKLSATANNGSTIFSSDPGLVKIAYPGDSTGNYGYSALDASRIARVAVGLDSGFDPFGNVDPVLIGDVTGNGKISSLDAAKVLSRAVGIDVAEVGALPNLLTPIVAGGPDPIIQVGTINATPGDSVSIPLSITDSAAGVQSLDLTLRYDATKLEITGASTAGLTTGWTLLSNTSKPGEIKVSLFTTTALTGGTGTIINLNGKVLAGAAGSSIALDLVQDPAAINEGELLLTSVDGQINLPSKTLDFNGDGNVDTFDSILMMRHMMGTYPGESIKKDIPGTFDLTAIQRKLTNAFADTFSLNGGLRLDIDGDKRISAFRDGMMITQHILKQGISDSPWAPPGFNPPAGLPAQMQQHLKDLIGF